MLTPLFLGRNVLDVCCSLLSQLGTEGSEPSWSHGRSGSSSEPTLTEMSAFSEDFGLNVEYGSR